MLMNSEEAVTSGLFSNTRTVPNRSATNQRVESPFTCNIWTGSPVILGRFGNTRSVPMVVLLAARSGARQDVLLGRASSPLTIGGVFCGGGSCEGGGVSGPPSPLEAAGNQHRE